MISNHNREEGTDTGDKGKNAQVPIIRLDRQLKYEGSILKIYEDGVLTNGHEAEWNFIHHDGAAAVLPIADDRKILMVHQYRNVLDRYILEIPVGKLDEPEESKVECALRELEEETGYGMESPGNLKYPMSLTTTVVFCDEAIDIFVARSLISSHQRLDEDEVVSVVPCSLEELEDMVYTGKIAGGKTIVAVMTYARKYRSEDKKDSVVWG